MPIAKKKLYIILLLSSFLGYIWIFYNMNLTPIEHKSVGVCIIKQATNIPCPSCGSTRSVISIIQGNVVKGLLINPLGLIILFIMLITPIWILVDLIFKRDSMHQAYIKIENNLKKTKIAMIFILLIAANWIWNIMKGM